ncbi:hypothetical protein GCM10017712_12600 [Curtobacterium citreum]|uniref:Restriction endonuclease n=1 Tax=Curtobacterium citreum TaxID=2036 RepID=P71102_9MICO|nr:restriction endonuclease [Curtobacterium albidum]
MDYAFRDRPLDDVELEVLRLVLSSFRDGSGQVVRPNGGTMPGFRDYERGLAAVLHASAPENKGVFDVIVPVDGDKSFGISCKMATTPPAKHASSFMELSNSAAQFRQALLAQQINWATEPGLAGPAIVRLVTGWHDATADTHQLDLPASKYSVLAHNPSWTQFQLLCFPLDLQIANPVGEVEWLHEGASLNGYIDDGGRRHRLWQCYMNSGGQLKYYPLLRWADWVTEPFTLELPPVASPILRARDYFNEVWPHGWDDRN